VMFAVQGKGVQYSFCVPIALFAAAIMFPICMSVVPRVRAQVDPHGKRDEGGFDAHGDLNGHGGPGADRLQTPIQRLNRGFTVLMAKFKDPHDHDQDHERESGDLPTVEHRERRSWGSKSEK
jgi:hypothetical protein